MDNRNILNDLVRTIIYEEIEIAIEGKKDEIRAMIRSDIEARLDCIVEGIISSELERVLGDVQMEGIDDSDRTTDENHSEQTALFRRQTIMHETGGESALYLYGLGKGEKQFDFGSIGIGGAIVRTIPFMGFSAIVHACQPEPYVDDDDTIVKGWIQEHQAVLDNASIHFPAVIPFGFDTIIRRDQEKCAEDVLRIWIEEDNENLCEKSRKILGKQEYGVQIFYDPAVFKQDPDDSAMTQNETASKNSPGRAYLQKKKHEQHLRESVRIWAERAYKEISDDIEEIVSEIKYEKIKGTDDRDQVMLMNLSCLAGEEEYRALGDALDNINNRPGFNVRFTGPWPPYSFV